MWVREVYRGMPHRRVIGNLGFGSVEPNPASLRLEATDIMMHYESTPGGVTVIGPPKLTAIRIRVKRALLSGTLSTMVIQQLAKGKKRVVKTFSSGTVLPYITSR